MEFTVPVRDIMTRNIITVETTEPVRKVIDLMIDKDIGSVIVTENQKPVGIVTERDILKKVCRGELCSKGATVEEIMSKPLITIETDEKIGDAALLMKIKHIRRLLVTEKGEAVGIITQKDLMKGTVDAFLWLAWRWI